MGNQNMKTSNQKICIIMFFIALCSVQFAECFELSSLVQLQKPTTKVENFEEMCYYELKQELIIKKYVEKIKAEVQTVYIANKHVQTDAISFTLFWKIFKEGRYGKIATELANSEDYVRAYWGYFTQEATMTHVQFTRFMGLYYLEGDLLTIERHPTLTQFFPNEHNINRRLGCDVAHAYWVLVTELLHRVFIEFKWSTTTKIITVTEIFTIITNTHYGKCHLFMDKQCKFFTKLIERIMGFFNMSSGNRPTLIVAELKMAYSTMLFNDIFEPACAAKNFDGDKLSELVKRVGL